MFKAYILIYYVMTYNSATNQVEEHLLSKQFRNPDKCLVYEETFMRNLQKPETVGIVKNVLVSSCEYQAAFKPDFEDDPARANAPAPGSQGAGSMISRSTFKIHKK